MELKKLLNSKVGDILRLDDMNALMQLGGAFESDIVSVHTFTHPASDLKYKTLEIKCGDLEMSLIIKTINDEHEIKMFTRYDEGSFQPFIESIASDYEETEGLPTGFIIDPANGDEEDEYLADEPFPIYGFEKDEENYCAIGEYTYNGEADSTYCATYSFMEWYISEDKDADDLDNYFSIYFGWKVSLDDLDVFQG